MKLTVEEDLTTSPKISYWEQLAYRFNTLDSHPENAQNELRVLVPQLIRAATGRERPGYGIDSYKPKWWPKDVPWTNPRNDTHKNNNNNKYPGTWTDALRTIVHSCYASHGQEQLLTAKMRQGVADPATNNPIEVLNTFDGTVSFVSPSRTDSRDSTMEAHVPVMSGGLQGPYPTGAFMSVSNGGAIMEEKLSLASKLTATVPPVSSPSTPGTPSKTFVEIFICFFCEKEFKDRPTLQTHQEQCSSRPATLALSQIPQRTRRLRRPQRPKPPAYTPYKAPAKSTFVDAMGLVPTAKADKILEKNKEVDCEIIDLVEENPVVPKTPTTPRSQKSIMSQLSRDLSPTSINRMSLDFSEPKEDKVNNENESDSESESGKSDGADNEFRPTKVASLLTIDFCSPLGQRVKKNILEENSENVESEKKNEQGNYEVFCHTPKKSNFMDRLRHRQTYWPITYRKKRCTVNWQHDYKFSKRQRKEFMKKIATGLNKKSRRMKLQMKKCMVLMQKMPDEEIKKWTEKKLPIIDLTRLSDNEIARWKAKRKEEGYVFPTLRRPAVNHASEMRRMLGYRNQMEFAQRARNMSLSQLLSADTDPRATQQKLMMYRHLLTEAGNTNMAANLMNAYGGNQWNAGYTAGNRYYGNQPQFGMNQAASSSNTLAALLAKARKRHQSNQSDDVISISSCDSDDNKSSSGRNRKADKAPPAKKRKTSTEDQMQSRSHAVLFKCHLCYQEILFNLSTTDFIKNHFAEKHSVHNIQILEHRDQNNQIVLSIVEDSKTKSPAASVPSSPAQRPGPKSSKIRPPAPADEVICID